jgi:hypothetical protein
MPRSPKSMLLALAFLLLLPPATKAQEIEPAAGIPQQQIDQMTAPIALYPDAVVAQILMAATYPLEVVEASRWIQAPQNAQLRGDQLALALQQQSWDPSVKSLVNFPEVLALLNNNLQWTEQLGNAFLGQEDDVTDSIQRLRHMAESTGTLVSTPQQNVSYDGNAITITPANPDTMYIPYYNPSVAYGTWPYPDEQPYYFPPPPGLGYTPPGVLAFGGGFVVVERLWGWNRWDWHRHRIDIDDRRFTEINRGHPPATQGVWTHDSGHRHGVPYTAPAVRSQFQNTANPQHQNFRGYSPRPEEILRNRSLTPPTPVIGGNAEGRQQPVISAPRQEAPRQIQPRVQTQQHPTPPVFESFSRGPDVRSQSERGFHSRSTTPPATPKAAPETQPVPSQKHIEYNENRGRDDAQQHGR